MLRFPLRHDSNGNGSGNSNGNGNPVITGRPRRLRIWSQFLLTAGFLMIINIFWSDTDPSASSSWSSSWSSSSSLSHEGHRLLTDDNGNGNNEKTSTTEHNETVSIENFFMHTPKAGGVFAFRFLEDLARSVRSSRPPCYIGTRPLETLLLPARGGDDTDTSSTSPSTQTSSTSPSGDCLLYMSERKYSQLPKRTYAIVRNPRDHVLSQFFHCKESDAHGDRARFMPDSLDEWLEAWVATLDSDDNHDGDNKFHCYDPRNMQTSFVFHSDTNTTDTNNTATATATATATEIQPIDLQELERKFQIIAPAERMTTSLCVIFIHISGLVPDQCICDDDDDKEEDDDDEQDGDEEARNRKRKRKRQLNGPLSDPDHGVIHHAHSFETTDRQEELIGKLVERDNDLYDRVWELFEKRLGETERDFGVKIC